MKQHSTSKNTPFFDVRKQFAPKGQTPKNLWSVTLTTDNSYLRDEVAKRLFALVPELNNTYKNETIRISQNK